MTNMFQEIILQGIHLPNHSEGTHKTTCPQCSHTRKKKTDPCLYVNVYADHALWKCYNCEWSGGAGKLHNSKENADAKPREYKAPDVQAKKELYSKEFPQNLQDYFAKRGLNMDTVRAGRVSWMESRQAISFPFFENDKIVNIKHRVWNDKSKMWQEKDAKQVFYGIDDLRGKDEMIIVEGEFDKLALNQVGFMNVVSVPSGSTKPPAAVKDKENYQLPDNSPKFEFLRHAEDILKGMKKIVLALDNDEAGNFTKKELMRRLGKERCWTVSFPEEAKDANDVLMTMGSDVLCEFINEAKPAPIEGLFTVDEFEDTLLDYFRADINKGMSTGWTNVDNYYTVMEGELTVITGIPNSGKSEWLDALAVNMARYNDWKFAIFSPENTKEQHVTKLAEKIVGRSADPSSEDRMTEEEFVRGYRWVKDRFFFLESDNEKNLPTFDWILDKAYIAVQRYGVQGLIIDPYNEIEHKVPAGMNETLYISMMLSRIKRFAKARRIHVWIVAHPAKLQKNKENEILLPTLYDIAGCYSDDTEVLTKDGWKLHQNLVKTDLIMSFDPKSECLSYQPFSHLTVAPYKGKMHHYSGYSTDLMVTPNHRMVMQAQWKRPGKQEGNEHLGRPDTWSHEGWEFVKSEDLKQAKYYMPLAGNYVHPSGTNDKAIQKRKKAFLSLLSGFGNKRKDGSWRVGTDKKAFADSLQQIAIEMCFYATVAPRGNSFEVNIGRPQRNKRVIVVERNRSEVDYEGLVYCLTVPTGAYITRRNGVMAICGNSANWVNKADNGVVVHRGAQKNVTEIHIKKVRFKHVGRQGDCTLVYERGTGTYSVPNGEDAQYEGKKTKRYVDYINKEEADLISY